MAAISKLWGEEVMKYLLGIDFGGGSMKATLINSLGNIIAEHTEEYETLHPTAEACEQRVEDWISALCEGIQSLLEKSKVEPMDILSVAIDSATHTNIICDANYMPIRNAIHWTDSRSRKQAELLREQYGELIFKKTYHRPDTIWTLPQLVWLQEHEPENYSKMRYIFFEKDYIRFFLTDAFCTDYIEAQGSMLYNCETNTWDEELCGFAGVEVSMLPPIKKPTDIVGTITEKAARATGLQKGTPVICGTTDTVLEVLAAGAIHKGDMTVKLATAGRICIITDQACPDTNLVNYSHVEEGLWYPGTGTKAAASSYRWYRDTFGGDYELLNHGAEQVALGCDGLMFHPYINGELTPYADPLLCGSFVGIRSTHSKGHFTRAVLEGVVFSLLDCKLYLEQLEIPHAKKATVIGGGSKGELWRQILSDALGIELITTQSSDSSLGAAMLAGIAVGVFADIQDAVNKCVKKASTTSPIPENTKKYRTLFEKYKRIHDALAPIYRES